MIELGGLWALTVTFNPELSDGTLERQIRQISQQGLGHVVVDNGSNNQAELKRLVERLHSGLAPVLLLPLPANYGIAAALNRGVSFLQSQEGARWILTLDQDTCFEERAFDRMAEELSVIGSRGPIGIIAFNYYEHRFNRVRPYNRKSGPLLVRSMITSGSITSVDALRRTSFNERLFLYFVDVDFCHAIRRMGFEIWVLRSAFIDHREGRRIRRANRELFGLDPTRLFFVVRNGIWVFRKYGSLKALLVAGYLVAMNCLNGVAPRKSLEFARRGFLASVFPERFPPPFGSFPPSSRDR